MPYNATWIEPWMRPLKKTALRRRIPNQTADLRAKAASKKAKGSRVKILSNNPSRRATRQRRLSSKNHTKFLTKEAASKRLTPKGLKTNQLGSKI